MQITNRIHFRNFSGDLFGGITAAVIALPMALTFGVASGAGPAAGLYGAILVGFFAALFGGTPTLISEPTGPMTVIMTAVITNLTAAADDPEKGLAMAFTVVMMAGVLQILFGVLRLGKYVTLMPYTVVSGFMSGIGIILVILQLGPFLGEKAPKGGVLGTLGDLPNLLSGLNSSALFLSLLTVAVIVLIPIIVPTQFKKWFPPQLIALLVGTLVSMWLFPGAIVDRIEPFNAGLPTLRMPVFTSTELQLMFVDAMILAVLGCIDALLTSVVADSLTRTEHNSNKELIGQGIGNLMSGLCGGIAGAGATMGTVVNIQAGGRTALSGLIRAFILMIVVLWAAPLTQNIPLAVLAGIALKVGIDIIDWDFLKRAHQVSWKGTAIMYGVIALTVFVDLMVAVGIGVFIANIVTIDRLSMLQSKSVKAITDADDEIQLTEEEKKLLDQGQGRILLFHLSGPMIFGVAKAISREQKALKYCDALILDLSDVPHMGVTSSLTIENAIDEALDKGCSVFVVGAAGQTKRRLGKLGIWDRIAPENLLSERVDALRQSVDELDRFATSS
ncbi:SulP family inorganic anion transporter [Acaryochloris sp. IP29b_bin.137]|uniref:bicarbonate transporter BicA n=1 Tax=Acaryochloris sp. IP29b_bin.137 TaxID=2969217 RepID=UPI002614AB5A|nr:SulP family inorganic anion transporter [Acaryochloris sp. IP29b_bin.137]